ncbi:MAG: hypothetical protein ABIR96_07630 [Bdellovibrionota bacterium]
MSHSAIKRIVMAGLVLGILPSPLMSVGRAQAQTALKGFSEQDFKTFESLLEYYKKYPQYHAEVGGGTYKFPPMDPKILRRLSADVLVARYRKFNSDYRDFSQQENVLGDQIKKVEGDMDKMPLSDTQNRSLQELKRESLRGKIQQSRKILVMLSIQANESVLKAIETLSPEQRLVKDQVERPKMPGVFGGSSLERDKSKEIDKLNLTPVDPEFYATQLGQKLEKDLGGRAQFWSYDYGRDELYVKVNDDLGKLSVFKDTSGTRFIRTRVGSEFMDPKGRDEQVDLLKAKGKFLTGEPGEESLFGDFPKNDPSYIKEGDKPHSANDGHHHH